MLLEEDGNYIHMKCGVALICSKWVITSGDCAHELKTGSKFEHSVKFGNLRWDIVSINLYLPLSSAFLVIKNLGQL